MEKKGQCIRKIIENHELSRAEIDFREKIKTNVVFLRLKKKKSNVFGHRAFGPSVFQISELFTKFGDINVSEKLLNSTFLLSLFYSYQIVKKTQFSCYVELQDVDWDVVNDTYKSSTI